MATMTSLTACRPLSPSNVGRPSKSCSRLVVPSGLKTVNFMALNFSKMRLGLLCLLALDRGRTRTSSPFAPGIAPLTRIRFFSAMTLTTRRFWTVRRSLPMWPGIDWFFQVRPGVWRMPIEPMRRWNIEPWAAGPPPTRKRFTTPWKPLPFVIADDVDQLALLEGRHGDRVADLELGGGRQADLGEDAGGVLEAGLLRVGELGLGACSSPSCWRSRSGPRCSRRSPRSSPG